MQRSIGSAALAAALFLVAAPLHAQFAGTVAHQYKIGEGLAGFTQDIPKTSLFGVSVISLGDLDHDGTQDIMVGAYTDNEYAVYAGAAYVLFLKPDGTVKSFVKIGSNHGGFATTLQPLDMFGWSLCNLGDLDGDGTLEVAVGAWLDDSGGSFDNGAVYVLSLGSNGMVQKQVKITNGQGGFADPLYTEARFGTSLTNLGDLDGDGVNDLLAGAIYDNTAAYLGGTVYTLFLKPDGTVKSQVKITMGIGGFSGDITHEVRFGYASTNLGDLDGDGVIDVAVSSFLDDDGGTPTGAVWILFMAKNGEVDHWSKLSSTQGGLLGPFEEQDGFGSSVARLPDLNGDGLPELAVGAIGDDDGGDLRGAVYVISLDRKGRSQGEWKISSTKGGFGGPLSDGDRFGQSACTLGDLDGDGTIELAVGADHDNLGGDDAGAVWVLSLERARFTWLGHEKGSIAGTPLLTATGPLTPASILDLRLEGAMPQRPGLLFVSTGKDPATLAGGVTLVPDLLAQHLVFPAATDAIGGFDVKAIWPAGVPGGLRFYVQTMLSDPNANKGVVASNALMGIAP